MSRVNYNAWRDGGQLGWIELLLPSNAKPTSLGTKFAMEVGFAVGLAAIMYVLLVGVGSSREWLTSVDWRALRTSIAVLVFLILFRPQFELCRRLSRHFPNRLHWRLLIAVTFQGVCLWLSFVFPRMLIEVFVTGHGTTFDPRDEKTLMVMAAIIWFAGVVGNLRELRSHKAGR